MRDSLPGQAAERGSYDRRVAEFLVRFALVSFQARVSLSAPWLFFTDSRTRLFCLMPTIVLPPRETTTFVALAFAQRYTAVYWPRFRLCTPRKLRK